MYKQSVGVRTYRFPDLKTLLARASPERTGDQLAGLAAADTKERTAACLALVEVPLAHFLDKPLVPYERDEVTRAILDSHDAEAFAPLAALTVGDFRNWLLADSTDGAVLARAAPGITPEMAAAVSKLMRNQDLIAAARKCRVVTAFRTTVGLPGRLSTRLQPNHPTDDPRGILASVVDGLMYGSGDAVVGINPAGDSTAAVLDLLRLLDRLRTEYRIPMQSCVLTHVTTQIAIVERVQDAPVDLVFQSIAGTEAANRSFGIGLQMLQEALEAARSLGRGTVGNDVMYFETGQGSALSADAHEGLDQQTCEARAYGVARRFAPLLVNTVVGFIGPEYLYDGRQILRAGLEDHFCGKLLGLPMGVDVCYTNHAEADQNDMDTLLTLLGAAGVNFVMGVPGADDIMLNYQSTSFHDALYLREVLGLRPAPEFEDWLLSAGIGTPANRLAPPVAAHPLLDCPRSLGGAHGTTRAADPQLLSVAAPVVLDPWIELRRYTDARVALGRAGHALPTAEVLRFQLGHAQARDAVLKPADFGPVEAGLRALGYQVGHIHSRAPDRTVYLKRPDWGRLPDDASLHRLEDTPESAKDCDLVLIVGDGLSAAAVEAHAVPMLAEAGARLREAGARLCPIVWLARQARVALSDEIGERLRARIAVILIGERPGLSSPDSLGLYLTYGPRRGRQNAERNCISNVRTGGLSYPDAAARVVYLARESLRVGLSGVGLKDLSDANLISTSDREAPRAPRL